MNNQEAREQVKRLVAECVAEREIAERASRTANGLAKIIAGYVEVFPNLRRLVEDSMGTVPTTTDGAPRGAEAVRLILQETPNVPFWVSELVDQLKARDWLPDSDNPANAVRAALGRLVNNPESDIVRATTPDGRVLYSYQPDREHPDEREEDPF